MKPALDPFGTSMTGRHRILFAALGAGALLLLAVGVYLAMRSPSSPVAAPAGHDHTAAPAADSAMPVMLDAAAKQRIGVTFATVEQAPLERVVRTVAQVSYDETAVRRVVTRVDGFVEDLRVSFTGQSVRAGEPLFTMYSPMVVTAEQELLLAQRLVQQVQGGSPDAVAGAAGLLESAQRRLQNWEVPAEMIERVLRTGVVERTVTLLSPATGVVVEKPVVAGQKLMAGEIAYLIADLRRVWLEGEVFEQDLPAVRLGQTVTADFTALPGETRTGRITYIFPMLNPETRTARVRVELANPGLRLKPGMYATFQFTAVSPSVLSVPRSAVLSTGKRMLVFVRDSTGTLIPKEITSGRTTDDRIEVRGGLVAGETVVASATFLVDAESNLGSALGGMANMPGMEITTPPQRLGRDSARVAVPRPAPAKKPDSMADMPDMTPSPKPRE
ncbi:MAG: efflux RND transporter periplasmic adaptor subunit [Gemmatimonadota bacterium]